MELIKLNAGDMIAFDETTDHLITGKVYKVLENEYTDNYGWRIIRVICEDDVPRKVPPQWFLKDGQVIGCRKCYDRGVVTGGEERGEYIKLCECKR